MGARATRDEQLALALDELATIDVLRITAAGDDRVSVDGRARWDARVHPYAVVGEALARRLVRGRDRDRDRHMVVADQISAEARRLLEQHRWSWVDRRVGAHIVDGERDVEIRYRDRGAPARTPAPGAPIRGRAGLAYAAALLCRPDAPPSFRQVAATVGMSPQSVSNAVKLLRDSGLVDADLRPTLPDLFWAVADAWEPLAVVAVATAPDPVEGWVLGGDAAAMALGAPVVAIDERPWLWVPSPVDVRRGERVLGPSSWDDAAAVLAVAPTPLLLAWSSAAEPWDLPNPVFAALELARDRGRGREVLDAWRPEGVDAVWR